VLALRIEEFTVEPQRDTGLQGNVARLQGARSRVSLLSNTPLFLYRMVKNITLYYHKDCYGCMELKPELKKVARSKGWKYRQVNVERCKTKFCDEIDVVPLIVVDGKTLSESEMEAFIEKEL